MTQESTLVHKLVADLTPRPWYSSHVTRKILWSIFAVLYLNITASICSGPPVSQLLNGMFVTETASFLMLSILFGVCAIDLSVPGKKLTRLILILAMLLLCIAVTLVFAAQSVKVEAVFDHSGDASACSSGIVFFALAPAAFGLLLLRWGAALSPGLPAFLMFLGAGFLGTAVLQFDCTNNQPAHVLTAHMLPAALMGMVGLLVARFLLDWNKRLAKTRNDFKQR